MGRARSDGSCFESDHRLILAFESKVYGTQRPKMYILMYIQKRAKVQLHANIGF